MRKLEFSFLGSPKVHYESSNVNFLTRKALALLIYLVVETGLHSRDKLATLFWSESNAEHSRGTLRTTLSYLRSSLQKINPNSNYLLSYPDKLGFNVQEPYQTDLQTVQSAYESLNQPINDLQAYLSVLRQATAVYKADFLDGFTISDSPEFDNWVSTQSEIWHRQISTVFERLTSLEVENAFWQKALDTANLWLKHDPLNETAYQQLIKIYLQLNKRSLAYQIYLNCREMLNRELGIKPSPQTEQLIKDLQPGSPTPNLSRVIPSARKINSPTPTAPIEKPLKAHILVVEDNLDQQKLLALYLQRVGYRVSAVSTGPEALNLLMGETVQLVITDAMMPRMTGYEFAQILHRNKDLNYIPVVMLTSLNSLEDSLQAYREGVEAFISKPPNYSELLEIVANLLNSNVRSRSEPAIPATFSSSSVSGLDKALGGSYPVGTNILLLGEVGSGKSTFARHFLVEGLLKDERGIYVSLNENYRRVRHQLNMLTGGSLANYEHQNRFSILDGSQFLNPETGNLIDLEQAVNEAYQTVATNTKINPKIRVVLDGVNTLNIYFEQTAVYGFLARLVRYTQEYNNTSTLFVVEQGSTDERTLANLKSLMDGVFEFRYLDQTATPSPEVRIANLKGQTFSNEWLPLRFY
jgi:DNA-binding SARP family transcriptional activator/KaiC/GvpD/RAD55 family RecA-like ATPase